MSAAKFEADFTERPMQSGLLGLVPTCFPVKVGQSVHCGGIVGRQSQSLTGGLVSLQVTTPTSLSKGYPVGSKGLGVDVVRPLQKQIVGFAVPARMPLWPPRSCGVG